MIVCLSQQCGVVCAAHGEGGGGAAVAEGERRIARTEGCNIGEGEGGSAAFCHRGFGWYCRRRGRGQTKILTSGEVSGILLEYPVQTIPAGVAQWQRN